MSPPEETQNFWLINPVSANFLVTSRFNDPRSYPNSPDKKQLHEGIDLNAIDPGGRPVAVLAAQRGVVDKVGNFPPGYGLYVRIRHSWPDGNTYVTWYGHLSEIDVQQGDFVTLGQRIGVAGDTGNSFGIHLHLTLQHLAHGLKDYVVDDVVDPFPFFDFGSPPTMNECMFVADVTVPDGTILEPGKKFPKTWRVRNSGSNAWGSGYTLTFFAESQMGAPSEVSLPAASPGEEVSVTVGMVAPSELGRYQSVWKPRDRDGNFFPFTLFADIVVSGVQEDFATFVADVTIPDGTTIEPGHNFLKTWRVRNTGSTTWRKEFRLVFFDDDQMGAPDSVPLPFTKPGEETDLSMTLKAPDQPGIYQSTWRFQNPQGAFFGDHLFAEINVPRTPAPIETVDEMSYVDDVTFADGTPVQPGQAIGKIWRVRNTGTTAWKSGYQLVYFGDEKMGGPDQLSIPPASPGQTVDLAVPLTAPGSPGVYRSTWKPRNLQGDFFDFEMFTEIEVVGVATPDDPVDDAKYVRDVTIPDGSVKGAGEDFLKTWRMRNTGSTTWGPGYEFVYVQDEPMGQGESIPLPVAEPGQEVNVSISLSAPFTSGTHKSTWRPRKPDGTFFGHFFFTIIKVPPPIPASVQRNKVTLVAHENLKPGSLVNPGAELTKLWRVSNTGEATWGNGYTLAFVEGDRFESPESVSIPAAEPTGSVRLQLPLKFPEAPGNYRGVWKLRDPQGNFFGARFIVSVEVRK